MRSLDRHERFLILLLLGCYGYFFYLGGCWNVESRICLTESLAWFGTLRIDWRHENIGDKAEYKGHYYCDKAIGASLLALPIYGLLSLILPHPPETVGVFPFVFKYVGNFFATVLPSVLLGWAFYRFLRPFVASERARLWTALSYGLGTIAFTYSTMLFGHQTAAAFIFGAFVLLHSLRRTGTTPIKLGLAGFLVGYAFLTEYPTFLIAVALFVYLLSFLQDKRQVGWFLLGALPPVLLLLGYNTLCFEHPFALAYRYEFNPEFRENMARGIMGITGLKLEALWGLTFGPRRGVFFISPFLILALPGFYFFFRRPDLRREFGVCVSVVLAFFLYNASYFLWTGGGAFGPRFLVPMLPFLALPTVFCFDHDQGRLISRTLAVVSILFVTVATATASTGASPETIGLQDAPNPLFDVCFRLLFLGDLNTPNLGGFLQVAGHPLPGVSSLLPLCLYAGLCGAGWAWSERGHASARLSPAEDRR